MDYYGIHKLHTVNTVILRVSGLIVKVVASHHFHIDWCTGIDLCMASYLNYMYIFEMNTFLDIFTILIMESTFVIVGVDWPRASS